ncbi:beta-lactamase family protein [Acetatifactor muris]|uniref:Esterase EstB n=1 Tax=Acetatifactor muris TaxID=879566 RepID=A0A2K4ZGC9_9FIRM|nr:serine hydrolase domain-containing protein [Acetatifactor muris]MCR2045784.1 beta-lactamase family protein [Acetatifactor muris]SOY29521.1 Esterase EstB [Acetatifactor muris]
MEISGRIQGVMEQAVKTSLVAGVNLLVEQDGRELIYAQAGNADREEGREMNRDTIFRLYSQTKPVTAAAAMILMDRGEIDLCQNVGEFLPAYRKLYVETADGHMEQSMQPLRLYNLLNMTSGLSYPNDSTASGRASAKVYEEACVRLGTEREMSTRELAERMAEGPLAYEPGSSWQYGTSADVLGAVIEVVSGKSLAEFMEEEIFNPLGMEDTAFYVPEEKQGRLAKVYETVTGERGEGDLNLYSGDHLAINHSMDHLPAYMAGGAGLVSTLDDYMKFARMLLAGGNYGGKRILTSRTVQYLTGGQLQPRQQRSFCQWLGLEGYSYGNLMRVCKEPGQASGLTRKGEYGWDGWLGVYFANFPEENMTILMGTQKKDGGTFSLTRKLRNLILSNF